MPSLQKENGSSGDFPFSVYRLLIIAQTEDSLLSVCLPRNKLPDGGVFPTILIVSQILAFRPWARLLDICFNGSFKNSEGTIL